MDVPGLLTKAAGFSQVRYGTSHILLQLVHPTQDKGHHAADGEVIFGKQFECNLCLLDSDIHVLTTGSGDEAKDVSMKVCPKATITVAGKEAKLADVKAGAAAAIKLGEPMKCGTKVAVGITVGG